MGALGRRHTVISREGQNLLLFLLETAFLSHRQRYRVHHPPVPGSPPALPRSWLASVLGDLALLESGLTCTLNLMQLFLEVWHTGSNRVRCHPSATRCPCHGKCHLSCTEVGRSTSSYRCRHYHSYIRALNCMNPGTSCISQADNIQCWLWWQQH